MAELYDWQHGTWERLLQGRAFWTHALLLKGRKGIGKWVFARHLAKSLLCSAPRADGQACGQCASCGWFEQDTHPNFVAVMPEALQNINDNQSNQDNTEAKSSDVTTRKNAGQQITIDQIRRLSDFVYLTGHQQGHKIVLIYPAETMHGAAANALLKKLEEPPENVLFILVTHQVQHLLPTIRSRCQQLTLPVPDRESALNWLQQQGVADPHASLAVAGFSPLLALTLAQGDHAASFDRFVQQLAQTRSLDALALAEALQSTNLPDVVNWLQKWCYDLVCYRSTGRIRYFVNQQSAIVALSENMDLHRAIAFARMLYQRQKLSFHPLNARLFLEELFLDYAAMLQR